MYYRGSVHKSFCTFPAPSRFSRWKYRFGKKIINILSKNGKYVVKPPRWFRLFFRCISFDRFETPTFGREHRSPLFKIGDEWFVEISRTPNELKLYDYDIRKIFTENSPKDIAGTIRNTLVPITLPHEPTH